jgi:hypothetical protein
MINMDMLVVRPYDEGRHSIMITEGAFKGIEFCFGRTWFEDENVPVLSFEYDVVSEAKPAMVEVFQQEIGVVLHAMLKKAITEESVVYSGGI